MEDFGAIVCTQYPRGESWETLVVLMRGWGSNIKLWPYIFLKHPLNEDIFHAKMTPLNKDFSVLFSKNLVPKPLFAQKSPKICQDSWKSTIFAENLIPYTRSPSSPSQSNKQNNKQQTNKQTTKTNKQTKNKKQSKTKQNKTKIKQNQNITKPKQNKILFPVFLFTHADSNSLDCCGNQIISNSLQ